MQWVNDEWAEIYEKLVQSGEKYFMQCSTNNNGGTPLVTVAGVQDYPLPPDFYKLRGVDVMLNTTQWQNAHRFNFERRNDFPPTSWSWPGVVLYDIYGQPLTSANGTVTPPSLHFLQVPQGGYAFRYWYFQPAMVITQVTDQMDLANGHEKALVFGVCARAALKFRQFEFADRMAAERDKQLQRITEDSHDMDLGEPKMIRVVRGRPSWRVWRWWRW
jgi:hypothetical protein